MKVYGPSCVCLYMAPPNDDHSLVTHHRRDGRASVSMLLWIGLALLLLLPQVLHSIREARFCLPWHLRYFLPLPQGHLVFFPGTFFRIWQTGAVAYSTWKSPSCNEWHPSVNAA